MKKALLLTFFLSVSIFGMNIDFEDSEYVIWNLLGDKKQEQLTTSVNWSIGDLNYKIKREKRNFRVVIDPGHGGNNEGAKGLFGLVEKYLTLSIAILLKKELINSKIPLEVYLTRETDESLELKERVQLANILEGDVFLSLHANASTDNSLSGFEVYFLSSDASDVDASRLSIIENAGEEGLFSDDVVSILSDVKTNFVIEQSSLFAEKIYSSLSTITSPNKRGIRQAPFVVLKGTEMPAVLLEVGYITNAGEALKLINRFYLKKLVNAISKGIIEYISNFSIKRHT